VETPEADPRTHDAPDPQGPEIDDPTDPDTDSNPEDVIEEIGDAFR
jgi:hypothetical protein